MGGNLSTEELGNRHVVIIGGGYAGMELGILLLKWQIPFTIIDLELTVKMASICRSQVGITLLANEVKFVNYPKRTIKAKIPRHQRKEVNKS